jgi:hypothetical protein
MFLYEHIVLLIMYCSCFGKLCRDFFFVIFMCEIRRVWLHACHISSRVTLFTIICSKIFPTARHRIFLPFTIFYCHTDAEGLICMRGSFFSVCFVYDTCIAVENRCITTTMGNKFLCLVVVSCGLETSVYSEFILNATEVSLRNIIILVWVGITVIGRGSWLRMTSETLQYLMQLTS